METYFQGIDTDTGQHAFVAMHVTFGNPFLTLSEEALIELLAFCVGACHADSSITLLKL